MFLQNVTLGIDITTTSINLVQLNEKKVIVAYGSLDILPDIIENGVIQDEKKFVALCKKVLSETKPTPLNDTFRSLNAYVSLPEDLLWSHTAILPNEIHEEDREQNLWEEASKIIPMELSELYTASSISKIHEQWYGTLIAAQKNIVDTYISCLIQAGLSVKFVGSNFYSIARAVLPKSFNEDNYMVIDFGSTHTMIGAFDENNIAYLTVQSNVLPDGADDTALSVIKNDILQVQKYFSEHTAQTLTKLLITGKSKNLSREMKNIQKTCEIETLLGDPCCNVANVDVFKNDVTVSTFASSIGLALFGIDHTLPHINLLPKKKIYNQNFSKQLFLLKFEYVRHHVSKILMKLRDKEISSKRKQIVLIASSAFCVGALILLLYVLVHYLT